LRKKKPNRFLRQRLLWRSNYKLPELNFKVNDADRRTIEKDFSVETKISNEKYRIV
jgi:hypothetical protein